MDASLSNVLLVIFTAVLAVVGVFQLFFMRYASDAARTSAEASKRSVEVAAMALSAGGPVLVVQDMIQFIQFEPDVSVIIRNVGQRPAIILDVIIGFSTDYNWVNNDGKAAPNYEAGASSILKSPVLEPNSTVACRSLRGPKSFLWPREWATEQLTRFLKNDSNVLSIYGCVMYRDATILEPEAKVHHVHFLWYFTPVGSEDGLLFSQGEQKYQQSF